MSITFINQPDQDNLKSQRCNLTQRGDDPDSIQFHRHCQATVCSAYGYQGTGKTWETINTLTLPNIMQVVPQWKEYFTSNVYNITEDLASILELIDKMAAAAYGRFKIGFQDDNGNMIDSSHTFNLGDDLVEHIFKIGRTVNLTINGQPLSFNTVKAYSGDILDLTLNEKTITLRTSYAGTTYEVGRFTAVSQRDQPVDLATHLVDFKVNGTDWVGNAFRVVGMHENKTINIPEKTLTVTSNSETLGSANVVMNANKTINLPTHKLEFQVGSTAWDNNNIQVVGMGGADKTINIPQKKLTINATSKKLADFDVVMSGDTTISLATDTLSITKNDVTRGSVSVVGMGANKTIDVSHDYCKVPASSNSTNATVSLNNNTHAYHISATGNITPSIQNVNSMASGTDIVAFELHVKNNGSSEITVSVGSTGGIGTVRELTDLKSVQPGWVNVWVYRYDRLWGKSTVSLAYMYQA